MSLTDILRSGYVRRYHANPDLAHIGDTVAHHHAMVAQIVLWLNPDASPALIYAALHHDCGEMMVGDLPAPFKEAAPELAAAHAQIEAEAARAMGAHVWITPAEGAWLTLADRLAAYVHVRHVAPHVLGGSGWPVAREALLTLAAGLGWKVKAQVVEVLA